MKDLEEWAGRIAIPMVNSDEPNIISQHNCNVKYGGDRPSIAYQKNLINSTTDHTIREALEKEIPKQPYTQAEYNKATLLKPRHQKTRSHQLLPKGEPLCLDHELEYKGQKVMLVYDNKLKKTRMGIIP